MSDFDGDKTEQPTGKRLEDAYKHGQFARSPEVQTVFVLAAGFLALTFTSREIWRHLAGSMAGILGHLHDLPFKESMLQGYLAQGALLVAQMAGPIVGAVVLAGLLAGALQNRFHTSPEAIEANWARLNPIPGLQRLFTLQSAVPGLLGVVRLAVVLALSYSQIRKVVADPIFYTAVDVARVAQFLAVSTGQILLRILAAMFVLAVADYAYQWWRTHKELMMTKQEVKDEAQSQDGNPEIKSRQKKLRLRLGLRRSLFDVPKADVVVTNPTHLAVALRYDRQKMKAPKVVAKGSRLNARRIRELARQHQVPIVENKPLARLLFKHGRVGGEIPAELYVAVAEVLAWVYRVNRFRYYTEQNQLNRIHADREIQPEPSLEKR